MIIPYILLQIVFVPVLTVIVIALVGPKLGKKTAWVVVPALIYTSLLLLAVGIELYNGGAPIHEEYVWASVPGIQLKFGFLADGLSLPIALVMNLIVAACASYSFRYMEHKIEAMYGKGRNGMYTVYYAAYILFAVGLVGVALSTNLIQLYIFLELVLIPSYLHIALFGYRDKERIALMYFIWNHIGAGVFLIGIVLTVFGTGGDFEISSMSAISGSPIAFWVVFLILVGWLIKMATFGFHVWLPWAHGEHPTSIAAIIATIVGLGTYAIVRLIIEPLFPDFAPFGLPLMVLALITMIYGSMLTLAQDDFKRLYACSTISQTAYSLLGIGALSILGIAGGVFYFISHIIGKSILFAVAGLVLNQTGTRDMNKMGGLAQKMPITALICIAGSMIISGVPPLSGFQAKWVLFTGIFSQGAYGPWERTFFILIAIFATFLSTVYAFWPLRRVFFGPLNPSLSHVKEAPLTMTVPLLILVLVSLLIGIFPDLVMNFLTTYLESLPFF